MFVCMSYFSFANDGKLLLYWSSLRGGNNTFLDFIHVNNMVLFGEFGS